MVLEETFQFTALLIITLVFSTVSLLNLEYRLLLKIVAGLCWFIMALTQIYYFGGGQLLAVPLMLLFLGLGMAYSFSIVTDFRQKKRDEIYNFD
jgi:hypothetical protein